MIERDWLGRWCHLSEADLALIDRRREPVTRLGLAVQLATVRAIDSTEREQLDDLVLPTMLMGSAPNPGGWLTMTG